jgi:hypothetical protein
LSVPNPPRRPLLDADTRPFRLYDLAGTYMAETNYIQDANGVYWYKDEHSGGWLYWDGAKWVPFVPVPTGHELAPRGRRLDYRDKTGTYWRFFADATQWERYDGTRWVASATPPPGSVGSFNPLTSGGRRRSQRLIFATFAVLGTLSFWLAAATHEPGEALVGFCMWVIALVAGVNSLRKQPTR